MAYMYISPFLWFLAGWQGGALLVGLLGLPAVLGFVPGILMGVAVAWDARRTAPARQRIRPINQVAAELGRQAEQRPSTEAGTRRA